MMTEQLTQALSLANPIHPQVLNNATLNTAGIDMQQTRRAFFVLDIGAVVNGGSINAKLQESADNTSWSDLAGANVSITAKTTASKLETFEVRAGQLSKRYVRLQVAETGGQNVYVCAQAIGGQGIHKPNSANNGTAVDTQSVVY
jgi:hypothetical protein